MADSMCSELVIQLKVCSSRPLGLTSLLLGLVSSEGDCAGYVERKACSMPEGWMLRDDGGRSVVKVKVELSATRNTILFIIDYLVWLLMDGFGRLDDVVINRTGQDCR